MEGVGPESVNAGVERLDSGSRSIKGSSQYEVIEASIQVLVLKVKSLMLWWECGKDFKRERSFSILVPIL